MLSPLLNMSRRKVDKKFIEIHKDPASSKHITQILWSQDKNELFSEQDFFSTIEENLSETGRTNSSSSWRFDEFEIQSTSKIKTSLDSIDDVLYEGERNPSLNKELFEECQEWAKRFPYLRLIGKQLAESLDDGVIFDSTDPRLETSTYNEDCDIPSSSLCAEGKKMPLYDCVKSPVLVEDSSEIHCSAEVQDDFVEEIIAQNGEYEEYFAFDKSDDCDKELCFDDDEKESVACPFSVNDIKEKVIEKLIFQVWPNVVSMWKSIKENKISDYEQGDRLPPISASSDYFKSLSFQRPKTESRCSSDFPQLDGILTVSPKVLQKRKEYRIESGAEVRTRPNTGLSLKSRASEASSSPHHTYCRQVAAKHFSHKQDAPNTSRSRFNQTRKTGEKEAELLGLYLPVLEEYSPTFQDFLQGMHIEPEKKHTPRKTPASVIPHISVKPSSFLPPIDDREQTTIFYSQNEQIPIAFESYVPTSKNRDHSNIFTRHLTKTIPRPNTSKTYRGTLNSATSWKNSTILEDFTEVNGFDSKCKPYLSPYKAHNLSSNTMDFKHPAMENIEKLATLFPVVTSLEPRKDTDKKRSQQGVKRGGLLGAFNRRNQR